MTGFGEQESRGYDRRATKLLGGLYRHIADEVAASTGTGEAVLDVGTGPGLLLAHLARRRPDLLLHGVDLSPHMIAHARTNLAGHEVELSVGDVGALPYPDNSFDLVVSSLSMHEWPDPVAAAAELGRVLRPRGTLAIYDFRFVRDASMRTALGARFAEPTIRRKVVRPRGYPFGLYAQWTARAA
ncbi:Methyltransferase domain-containing protein [Nocardia amikacinitolerans]|uniref:class I SAM-dependent methyltransferase n=1 Tax=Nocardia amikacinitolerans TaxID=756689 RepID=UPI0020A5936A|nr:class I SAM-dependent methyltransferase [Nocardia amikacinitolerans]MCP2297082.1 Methyltransferase domain-containing protein [Nocardia amikacinitolerans]